MAEASIVFRNKDMSSTGKIYVDHMYAAVRLAAKYRNASYFVDVINRRDEVAYRWEDGKPAWGADIEGITTQAEAYQFERPDDPFWVAENRFMLLVDALLFAFEVVADSEDQSTFDALLVRMEVTGDEIWDLIHEARNIAAIVNKASAGDKWVEKITLWMQNSRSLFLQYRIEHAALSINSNLLLPSSRLAHLDAELTDMEAINR